MARHIEMATICAVISERRPGAGIRPTPDGTGWIAGFLCAGTRAAEIN